MVNGVMKEFKLLQQLEHGNFHLEIKICCSYSFLLPFYIVNKVCYKWIVRITKSKHREGKIYSCMFTLSLKPYINKKIVVLQNASNIALNCVPHMQHNYFSIFNLSCHCFLRVTHLLLLVAIIITKINKLSINWIGDHLWSIGIFTFPPPPNLILKFLFALCFKLPHKSLLHGN